MNPIKESEQKECVVSLWEHDQLPVTQISERVKLPTASVKLLLGEHYTEAKRIRNLRHWSDLNHRKQFDSWLTTSFDKAELEEAVNERQLKRYITKLAERFNMSYRGVRQALIDHLGALPQRNQRYRKSYRISARSKWHGRECELIHMFYDDGLTRTEIRRKTGISAVTLTKVLLNRDDFNCDEK